tara:strand:- start:12783 stop:13448 length:666 start_codon:yes stop_codon:yes gene_type:complete
MTLKKYIQNKKVDNFTISGIQVFVKDQITNEISAKAVLNKLLKMVPSHLLRNVESIYIGSFKTLEDKDLQAMYENSSIFVTNEQTDEQDMLDDLVHEVAHSVEEMYKIELYQDKQIEKEFLIKRKQLWEELNREGLAADLNYFLEVEYSRVFDEYLYMQIGYPTLSMATTNIFYSPYAATSLREYFANGFEAFFMKEDINRLKILSPNLFKKIIKLLEKPE